jgi:hypothetical protein
MLWFFERSDQKIELETRFDNAAAEYVLIVRRPDGREQVERFADASSFRTRLVALEQGLETEHWHNTGPPVILPEGWPSKRPRQ